MEDGSETSILSLGGDLVSDIVRIVGVVFNIRRRGWVDDISGTIYKRQQREKEEEDKAPHYDSTRREQNELDGWLVYSHRGVYPILIHSSTLRKIWRRGEPKQDVGASTI